jgi:hypothetical protein
LRTSGYGHRQAGSHKSQARCSLDNHSLTSLYGDPIRTF